MRDHVFVCYARKDEQFVLQLAGHLKESGVPIWLDQWDIPAGANWDRSIDDAIFECDKFLIVLSPSAVDSSEVQAELRTALDEKKQIVPVIRSACRIPRQLRTIQYVDFSSCGPDDEATLKRLLRTLPVAATARVTQEVGPSVNMDQMRAGEEQSESDQDRTQKILIKPGAVFHDTLKDGSCGPEMVVVPAGEFQMGDIQGNGSDAEKPVHTVRIQKPFAIGIYPVTFEEYDKFISTTGQKFPQDDGWGRGRQPVINVSWLDAVKFSQWLSNEADKTYRLPTEAEWEYSARAGTVTTYWWGNEIKPDMANFRGSGNRWGGKQTSPVGSFQPNAFGLYDTAGNVWEWVQDSWHETYIGASSDGSAWESSDIDQRMARGGSWDYRPEFLRSSFRLRFLAGLRYDSIGFRLAQDLE